LKLEQLKYFLEAVKYKSISVAAEENYISQPTFSGAISKLEKELGATLLRRTSKGVVPTEAGTVVLEKSEEIFNLMEEMRQEVNRHEKKGVVKLSSIVVFYNHMLPSIIQKMVENQETFTLDATTSESAQIVQNVTNGTDNLGIIIHSEELLNQNLIYEPMFNDQYLLYVGKKSPLWEKESVTVKEVLEQPYIAYRTEFQKASSVWTEQLGKQAPNIQFRTDDLELLKKMIAQEQYVAFFPEVMSKEDYYLEQGLIRRIPISDAKLEIEVGYIYNTKYKQTQVEREFIAVLQTIVKELMADTPEQLLLLK